MITRGKNKTHKLCRRCGKLKSVKEFYRKKRAYDGLRTWCKQCYQESTVGIRGKCYVGLHKRPFPLDARCELCNKKLNLTFYNSHHWDDNNINLVVYLCHACDYLASGLDEIDRNPYKLAIYHKLKKGVEETEKTYVYSGPFLPPNGIQKLFLNGEQTHRWCPHCGRMLPINEFSRSYSQYDGLTGWCKKCISSSRIGRGGDHFFGLHKRAKPNRCELCGVEVNLAYHHWDDANKSKGIWVCQTNMCHNLTEVADLIDNNSSLPNKYIELKEGICDVITT